MSVDKEKLRALCLEVKADSMIHSRIRLALKFDEVLALIDEVERLEKFEDWFVRLDQADQALSASFKAERDLLKLEIYALRQDAQRYRWLREKQTFIWLIQDWFPSDAVLTDVDAEIDAAMAKERAQ
ncbi:hypothetical protein [Pseudomonas sp. BJa3]|uniref:hypothetical protein n=1 Tax=Pseudomonas sp. BJa3 TaxID=2986525 RepID=UPI002265B010|nr:hypothetical protein [Pseudomonas sp. BJa3]MCX5511308.1 hypothetical protein [Pseudomonas sp. BJa3]